MVPTIFSVTVLMDFGTARQAGTDVWLTFSVDFRQPRSVDRIDSISSWYAVIICSYIIIENHHHEPLPSRAAGAYTYEQNGGLGRPVAAAE